MGETEKFAGEFHHIDHDLEMLLIVNDAAQKILAMNPVLMSLPMDAKSISIAVSVPGTEIDKILAEPQSSETVPRVDHREKLLPVVVTENDDRAATVPFTSLRQDNSELPKYGDVIFEAAEEVPGEADEDDYDDYDDDADAGTGNNAGDDDEGSDDYGEDEDEEDEDEEYESESESDSNKCPALLGTDGQTAEFCAQFELTEREIKLLMAPSNDTITHYCYERPARRGICSMRKSWRESTDYLYESLDEHTKLHEKTRAPNALRIAEFVQWQLDNYFQPMWEELDGPLTEREKLPLDYISDGDESEQNEETGEKGVQDEQVERESHEVDANTGVGGVAGTPVPTGDVRSLNLLRALVAIVDTGTVHTCCRMAFERGARCERSEHE